MSNARCGANVEEVTVKKKMNRIDARWEADVPHDPRSKALYEAIAKLDYENGDNFDFKSGGDGDNGETLMYLLDIYFEDEDNRIKKSQKGGKKTRDD